MELIDLTIEDDVKDASGVTAIATVDSPAIEQGYFAFGSNKELKTIRVTCGSQKGNFAAPIGDRQILAGALMIYLLANRVSPSIVLEIFGQN